tara:strand:- start:1262 stop:1801 length:540 start_codon:yes stop_codon:yes gene_type:complete
MVIGIAGTLGAGKGTVVEYLKEKGFEHFSASKMLRAILESQGIVANREAYTILGDELRSLNPAGPIAIQYALAKDTESNIIIESIHDVPEAEFLKAEGSVLLGVDAPLELRYERIRQRGSEKDNVTYEEFERIAKHEEEGGGKHNIRSVIGISDHVISNEGSLEELHSKIDAFLETIHD